MIFRITYDGHELYEPQNGRPLLDAVCDLEAGTAGNLKFRIPPTHPLHDLDFSLRNANKELRLLQDNVELFRGRITKISEDDLACTVIEAEGQLAYLADSVVRPYATYDAKDAPDGTQFVVEDLFEWEIAQHNQHVGPEKSFLVGAYPRTSQRLLNTNYNSTLDDLKDVFCEGQDRYLRARSEAGIRYIDLLDGGVGEGTQAIVLGENLLSVDASREASDIVTAIVPVGHATESPEPDSSDPNVNPPDEEEEPDLENPPDPDPMEENPDRSIDNGYRSETHDITIKTLVDGSYSIGDTTVALSHGVVSNPQLTKLYGIVEEKREYEANDQEELLRLAAADLSLTKLSNQEISSVVVSAVDLHALNPDIEPIRILDWYHVFSKPHRIDQWIPCSQIHIVLGDPKSSTYRFGDLPATLTRRSALRMGMLRRGNGELIRRANGSAWNTDKAWDAADDAYKHADDVSDLLNQWKDEQKLTDEEIFNGLEDLVQQYVDLGGNLDELKQYMQGEIDSVNDKVIDGVAEAIAVAQRTQYGVCGDAASTAIKSVEVSVPDDYEGKFPFKLEAGAVVTVLFNNGNDNAGAYLNVNKTGSYPIYTNGSNEAFWIAGSTITFMFDGSRWQNCSTPIFGAQATIGDPGKCNMYTNGSKWQMRIGGIDYMNADMQGFRIGRNDYSHVLINSDNMTVYPTVGQPIVFGNNGSGTAMYSDGPLNFIGNVGYTETSMLLASSGFTLTSNGWVSITGTYFQVGDPGAAYRIPIRLYSDSILLNGLPVINKSIVASGSGGNYINVSRSTLGVSDLSGYAISVTNGDRNAKDCFPVGWSIDYGTLYIQFDRTVASGQSVRLNILGIPTDGANWNDPSQEGPEIFGDDEGGSDLQEPSIVSAPDQREENEASTLDGGTNGAQG